MSLPKVEISITETTREKNDKWKQIKHWLDYFNIDYIILNKDLDLGDYRIGHHYIERKTVSDYISSTQSNRMNNQSHDLSAILDCSWVFVIGDPIVQMQHTDMTMNSYIASQASIAMRKSGMGVQGHINFITVLGEMDFVIWLKHIQKRALDYTPREPLPEKLIRHSRDLKFALPFSLQSIPDIGDVIARNLLFHFGTIEKVVKASIKELMEVSKVGKKKAENIYKYFRVDYLELGY